MGESVWVLGASMTKIREVAAKRDKLIDAIPTGESPEIFALSPDATRAMVSRRDDLRRTNLWLIELFDFLLG